MQQDLSKIGIKVVGVPSPNADFYTKYLQVPTVAQRGVWDIALAGWGADWYGNAALSFFKPLFFGKAAFPPVGSNFGFYDSPTTNALIEQALDGQDRGRSQGPVGQGRPPGDGRRGVLPDHQPDHRELPRSAGA